jgi:hypothetical protein
MPAHQHLEGILIAGQAPLYEPVVIPFSHWYGRFFEPRDYGLAALGKIPLLLALEFVPFSRQKLTSPFAPILPDQAAAIKRAN